MLFFYFDVMFEDSVCLIFLICGIELFNWIWLFCVVIQCMFDVEVVFVCVLVVQQVIFVVVVVLIECVCDVGWFDVDVFVYGVVFGGNFVILFVKQFIV